MDEVYLVVFALESYVANPIPLILLVEAISPPMVDKFGFQWDLISSMAVIGVPIIP